MQESHQITPNTTLKVVSDECASDSIQITINTITYLGNVNRETCLNKFSKTVIYYDVINVHKKG